MGVNKFKISISVSPETLGKIRQVISKHGYRNRSHAFEAAIEKLLEVEQ